MSTRFDTIQSSFAGGEVDPLVWARSDTRTYLGACASALNVLPVNQGGLVRRPGTYFVGTLNANSRIFGFNFADDQRFIFAIYAAGIQVYTSAGVLVTTLTSIVYSGGPAAFVASPTQLRELQVTAAGDSIFLTHHTWRPMLVRRNFAGTWELILPVLMTDTDAAFLIRPWHKFADAEVTLVPDKLVTGATLTSSADHFVTGHLNTRLQYRGVTLTITTVTDAKHVVVSSTVPLPHDETGVLDWAATTAYVVNNIVRTAAGLLYICTVAGTSGATHPTGTGTGIVDGTVTWNYRALNPTTSWAEPAWSDLRGYPRTAVYHEQRLWFAGTTELPNGLWASRVGDYFNFNVGTGLDDEAIGVVLVTDRIPHIRHLHSARFLEVFTSIGEWFVPSSEAVPITPGNVAVKRQTPYGCSAYAPPCHLDGASLFTDRTGRAVREYKLDGTSTAAVAYSAESVSLLAPHLIREPVAMDVQYGTPDRPEQLAFVVNSNGSMAVFHSIRSEKVAAWYRWTTPNGLWRDVACAGDDTFFVVERDGVWYLELLAASQDELCLDCAETVSLSGSSYPGLAHLAGEVVSVTSPGWSLGLYTVSAGGVITLDDELEFDAITAGYDYGTQVKTLPAIFEQRAGPIGSRVKRIVHAMLRIEDTASISVGPYPLIPRTTTDDFSIAPEPVSGAYRIYQGGYDRLGQVTITQESPLPMSLLALELKVAF
jgi:hypothetical protein